MKADVINLKNEKVGEIDLPEEVFGEKWRPILVKQVLDAQISNRRKPLAHAKNRAEVSGGGRKPWRQKGTGRARHGSIRSPIWIGGGKAHGPTKDKNYEKKINKKQRKVATLSVLSKKFKDGEIKFFDSLNIESPKTKLIVIGNLLHEDSLMMKIKNAVYSGSLSGKFYEYPLISPDGAIAWPGKYPTQKEITEERKKIGNDIAWHREYLLQILPPEDRIIHYEWIKFYDQLPLNIQANLVGHVISVDPAISEKDTADKTAILVGAIYKSKDFHYLYITEIYNSKMNFPATKDLIEKLSNTVDPRHKTTILVEQVGYQEALIQALKVEGYPVEGINPHGSDKRARLSVASSYVKNGNVFFPKHRSAELVDQLVNFGVEKYDDLVDAFTMMVNEVFGTNNSHLNSQGPMSVKVIGPSLYGRKSGEDWADAEDRRMLHRTNRRAKWHRIIG